MPLLEGAGWPGFAVLWFPYGAASSSEKTGIFSSSPNCYGNIFVDFSVNSSAKLEMVILCIGDSLYPSRQEGFPANKMPRLICLETGTGITQPGKE